MIATWATVAPAAQPAASLAHWLIEQETRAMLRRLDRVKPFALQETMTPAAGLMPAALVAIERYLVEGRRGLRAHLLAYIRWLRAAGRTAEPAELQRRYTVLRLAFNTALAQLDLFSEAITQRSEGETGLWLSGLDVAAQDALRLSDDYFSSPPIICYLHRGLGGAIRRARTRLPGGGDNPVAIIRVPRERMIGFGVASSLVHEVGHQGAALLELVPSLRVTLEGARRRAPSGSRLVWTLWERWISEIVADLWAVAKVGVTSTLGLIGIVSLPRRFVFRIGADDPHPFPWIRVLLSCAIGDALYPHRQWRQLAATWRVLYPTDELEPAAAEIVEQLVAAIPAFVRLLTGHRPPSLRGRSLGEVLPSEDRTPDRLLELHAAWRRTPALVRRAPPTLVFAVLGRARIAGRLSPEEEDRLLGGLITHWALASTLEIAARCPVGPPALTT